MCYSIHLMCYKSNVLESNVMWCIEDVVRTWRLWRRLEATRTSATYSDLTGVSKYLQTFKFVKTVNIVPKTIL